MNMKPPPGAIVLTHHEVVEAVREYAARKYALKVAKCDAYYDGDDDLRYYVVAEEDGCGCM